MKIKWGKKWIIAFITAAIVIAGVFVYLKLFPKEKADTEILMATLQKSSELTSAKLTYKGMYHYSDSGVPILNKSDFYILYTATARAGINLSDAKVTSDDKAKTVTVVLPKSTVQSVDIEDPQNNVEFHDVGFALFNWNGRDDENQAISLAETDAKEKVETMGILEFADRTAQEVVKGLLENSVPEDYSLEVKTAE